MVRASDCGPEGRRFDPAIPPHTMVSAWRIAAGTAEASQGANGGSIPLSHPRLKSCECSTAVSIQVFQTWDEGSTPSTRTIFVALCYRN